MRQPSGHHAISQQQSSALAGRIASKKAELDNLKQLRDLSGALSSQMQMLEGKIATLKDGTEGWIPYRAAMFQG
ncbi:DASH complex subunit DAD2 [Aspergillus sp. HF37]|nr:DASH complex subunit DAD2 [Aspergillus sp. HF37]